MDRRNFILGLAVACVTPTALALRPRERESPVIVGDSARWAEQGMDFCEAEFTAKRLAEMKKYIQSHRIEPFELEDGRKCYFWPVI